MRGDTTVCCRVMGNQLRRGSKSVSYSEWNVSSTVKCSLKHWFHMQVCLLVEEGGGSVEDVCGYLELQYTS